MKKNIFFLIVVSVLLFFSLVFFKGLKLNSNNSSKDFIGKNIIKFSTISLYDSKKSFSNNNFEFGKFHIINIWASWCAPCREEHHFLMDLSNFENINLFGINFKDDNDNAISFLNRYGNPYKKIGIDSDGSLSINFGAIGVPETIVYDKNNKILLKYIGPLSKKDYKEIIKNTKN